MANPQKTRERPCKRCGASVVTQPFSRRMYCVPCSARVVADKAATRRRKAGALPFSPLATWHGTTNGYTNHCCKCDLCRGAYRNYINEWRKRPDVAERIRVRSRELAKRPEQILRKKARQYGLDVETLDAHLEQGVCFACGAVNPEGGLSVDHDHSCCPSSRKVCGDCVRGLLCQPCNKTLGMIGDSPERLQALIDYLDRWEAKRASQ